MSRLATVHQRHRDLAASMVSVRASHRPGVVGLIPTFEVRVVGERIGDCDDPVDAEILARQAARKLAYRIAKAFPIGGAR